MDQQRNDHHHQQAGSGHAHVVQYPSEADVAMLRASGYVCFEVFDRADRYLRTYAEWSADPSSYQLCFMSLSSPVKRICRFDLMDERDLAAVKELLESESIVKVTRKAALPSLMLARHYQIQLRSAIDLTTSNYLVNQVGANSGNLVNPRLIDDVGPTVHINMLRLAKIWLRLYGCLYCNLITLTEQNLQLFRTFQLD